MTDRKISRALLSVSDKTGLIDFAKGLTRHGVALISTGGTAKALRDAGLQVQDVSDITHFPEMMDGRVKTLHPNVHGGLLALRDKPDHAAAMKSHGIEGIDLLVCNLYPFEATVQRGADFETTIENIDIGGPAMTRSAAKNHDWVTVVVDVEDYQAVLDEMAAHHGATTLKLRRTLAQRAFARTAAYDAAVSNWFAGELEKAGETAPPRRRALGGLLRQPLRYGENPHQQAAFYVDGSTRPGVASARQLQGKELSYNNINDTDAAYELVAEFDPKVAPACAIIKHANPCGVAVAKTLKDAYLAALACDPQSAFGGVIAFNTKLGRRHGGRDLQDLHRSDHRPRCRRGRQEDPGGEKESAFAGRGQPARSAGAHPHLSLGGGRLSGPDPRQWPRHARQAESGDQTPAQRTGNRRHAVRLHRGQACEIQRHHLCQGWFDRRHRRRPNSRVDSARIAAIKAKDAAKVAGWAQPRTIGSSAASEAFFPFPDGLLAVAEAGATAVIQPGGSMNDQKVIDAADEAGLAMVFTGMRHFRH